ncbi:hypothetical protein Hanom_Chr10g00895341 [Helianthus anomalus]
MHINKPLSFRCIYKKNEIRLCSDMLTGITRFTSDDITTLINPHRSKVINIRRFYI